MTKDKQKEEKNDMGITVKKADDVSEWYTQVIQKADLIEYTQVSGCYILKPYSYAIWEKLVAFFDKEIKLRGVKNASFPSLIPESLFTKESKHVEGFTPEVAWVTHGGETKLPERLAVRPTSETVICDAFSRWVRSYRDLPIRVNQWCNIVRWEFKHPTPFLRAREFLWQEGHTIFATRKEAEDEVMDILLLYKQEFEELMAVPMFAGRKTDSEKFAGAEYTTSVETFLPVGKAIQGATSHYLGNHFAEAFDIKYLDEDGTHKFVHHNSWGFSTRSIGTLILTHGDDKGLVLPPKIAPIHVAIVPIIFDDTKKKVLEYAAKVKSQIKGYEVVLDDRDWHTAGYKFNHWELRGVPLRIECGPKDMDKEQVVIVRRDTGEKQFVALKDIADTVPALLDTIQNNLFDKAKKHLESSIVDAKDLDEAIRTVDSKKIARISWCGKAECEHKVTDACESGKALNMPFDMQKKLGPKCAICGEKAKHIVQFARSY